MSFSREHFVTEVVKYLRDQSGGSVTQESLTKLVDSEQLTYEALIEQMNKFKLYMAVHHPTVPNANLSPDAADEIAKNGVEAALFESSEKDFPAFVRWAALLFLSEIPRIPVHLTQPETV